jgi:Mrp family chromosome partitioning ATPase
MSISFLLEDAASPVIWRGPIRANVLRQFVAEVEWGPLDCLVVDLPPGTGDEPLTIAQAFPRADGAVIVTTPQEASLATCRKAINFVRAVGLPVLGVIENMSGFACPHCGQETAIFTKGGGEAMAGEMGVPFLGRVPLAPEVVALSDQGRFLLADAGADAVREPFAAIVGTLMARLRIAPVP